MGDVRSLDYGSHEILLFTRRLRSTASLQLLMSCCDRDRASQRSVLKLQQ